LCRVHLDGKVIQFGKLIRPAVEQVKPGSIKGDTLARLKVHRQDVTADIHDRAGAAIQTRQDLHAERSFRGVFDL
jgi:hypothetical protein